MQLQIELKKNKKNLKKNNKKKKVKDKPNGSDNIFPVEPDCALVKTTV